MDNDQLVPYTTMICFIFSVHFWALHSLKNLQSRQIISSEIDYLPRISREVTLTSGLLSLLLLKKYEQRNTSKEKTRELNRFITVHALTLVGITHICMSYEYVGRVSTFTSALFLRAGK